MPRAWCVLAVLPLGLLAGEGSGTAPSYSSASIVNSASNVAGALSPNGLATIYGENLSWGTRAVAANDITGGMMPVTLGGVRVYVSGWSAFLYYVSPKQINFLIPPRVPLGEVDIWVFREGVTGLKARVKLYEAAPGLFQTGEDLVVATHADGKVVTPESPARPDEIIVLYASGLGRTDPDVIPGRLVTGAATLLRRTEFKVKISGEDLEDSRILYAGVTPGFAGLYQVNLRLPESLPDNTFLQIWAGDQASTALRLAVASDR